MRNKPLVYILSLILFVIVLDYGLGNVYEELYFTEKSRKKDRLIHSAVGTNEDVLIFGSSRAYYHYNPNIIEDSLGLSCFNVGYGGQNIYYHLALLKAALLRNKPKIAILDLMTIDFEMTAAQPDKEKLGVLLPFVHQSNIYKEAVLSRGWSENIKLLSSIYPFNSKAIYLVRNNTSAKRTDIKGFVGLADTWEKPIENKEAESFEADRNKIEALHEFINLCQKNNISIFLFVSPHFANYLGKTNYSFIVEDIYKNYGLEVHNYINSPHYKNPSEFSDPVHLNKIGAEKYSKEVAMIIRKNL